jgi:hypothetical protein
VLSRILPGYTVVTPESHYAAAWVMETWPQTSKIVVARQGPRGVPKLCFNASLVFDTSTPKTQPPPPNGILRFIAVFRKARQHLLTCT